MTELQKTIDKILQDTKKSKVKILKEVKGSSEFFKTSMVTTVTYLRTLIPRFTRSTVFDITHQITLKLNAFEVDVINSSNNKTTYQVSVKEMNDIYKLLEKKVKENA